MPVSWNSELLRAAEARICYHVSIGSSREFMWRKAFAALQAVEKDIRLLSSGRIVNMPRLRETTAQQELEAVVRGERQAVPPEMVQAAEAPPDRDFERHPYLRRMEYRGGGFAILMAFEMRRQKPDMRQYMFRSELVREAQPFCDISMLSTDGWVRSAVTGWASHRSLLSHRLMLASRSAAQSAGGGREEYSLTEDGHIFLNAMLRKWPSHTAKNEDSIHARRKDEDGCSVQEARSPRIRKRWAKGLLNSLETKSIGTIPAVPTLQRNGEQIMTVIGLSEANSNSISRKRRMVEAFGSETEDANDVKTRSPSEADAETEIEISSEESEHECDHERDQASKFNVEPVLRLLVDERERLRDTDPRGLYERISTAVRCQGVDVSRHRLRLGDFVWIARPRACTDLAGVVLDCIVERKRISDLVGRSAVGAHVQQMRRLEACGLRHCFLLLEGDLNSANTCRVYDAELGMNKQIGGNAHVIRSKEDIDDLCARLIVRCSRLSVIMTKDAECSARTLAHLSNWLAALLPSMCSHKHAASLGPSLFKFEQQDAEYTKAEDSLRSVLASAGINALAVDSMCERHHSTQHARDTLRDCSSPEHRLHLFDCLPSCAGLGQQICSALGVSVPSAEEHVLLSDRFVYVTVSPEMKRRVFALDAPSYVIVQEDDSLASICFADIAARAESHAHPTVAFCSKRILVAAIPGAWMVHAVLQAITHLGNSAPPVNIATRAIHEVASKLPGNFQSRDHAICLAIIEGLRAAVLVEARQPHSSYSSEQLSMLPHLLGLVELTALALDLRLGWCVRMHETKPKEATSSFLRTLISLIHEEAYLSWAS